MTDLQVQIATNECGAREARQLIAQMGIDTARNAIEDVIVHKLIASRSQDIADIEAILSAKPSLDHDYISRWVQYWEIEDRWRSLNPAE